MGLYIHTVILYVYQLHHRGQKLGRLELSHRPPLHGDVRMRWGARPGLSGFIGQAEIRDTAGHGLVDPLRVWTFSILSLGVLLQGEQMWFNSKGPKSKCTQMPQAWFCTSSALPLAEWYDAWQGKLVQAATDRGDLFQADA